MSKRRCDKKFKKRNIRNALIRAGVPVNRNTNLQEDEDDYNDDEESNIFGQYISNITSCDARCQAENRRNEILKRSYLSAKENVKTAPVKRDVAEERYYVSAFGQAEYNETLNEKYKNEIKNKTVNEKKNFNNQKENLLLVLENFDKNISLNSKLNELIEITLIENNELIEKIEKINSTINTNERKTYYNSQQLDSLIKWKKYTMRYLFFIYLILFAIIVMINRNALNFMLFVKILLLLLIPLLFVPIITRIVLNLYNLVTNDASNMGPVQLLTKILLEIGDEMKLFVWL